MKFKLRKRQMALFGVIIFICIMAIGVIFYWEFFVKSKEKQQIKYADIEKIEELKNNFKTIFDNQLHAKEGQEMDNSLKEEDKDFVYTYYQKEEKIQGKYDLNVQIPKINVQGEEIKKCNNTIKELFETKVKNILALNSDSNVIYSVKYVGFLNRDILSIIILSNLKEAQNPQREIILTYNYDVKEKRILNLKEVISKLGLEEERIQNQIKIEVEEGEKQTQELRKLGYENLYSRDLNSENYKIENTKNFFIGNDGMLYIIYAYGNQNYTNTTDLILIPYE